MLRILWRLGPGRRLPPADSGLAEVTAKLSHYALYLLLVTVVGLGFCFRWSQDVPLSFFGWFTISRPGMPAPLYSITMFCMTACWDACCQH